MPSGKPRRSLADDERWRLAHRFLHDDTIDTVDRVVGLLVLLYGQPLTKISRLTTSHVIQAGQSVRLALGTHPVDVPHRWTGSCSPWPKTAMALPASAGPTSPGSSPASSPGRPRGTAHLRSRLTAYGLPSRRGRNSALTDLAAQMPPAVLSQVLGVGVKAATQWADAVGSARTEYAADRSKRPPR
ncbi:hypothetical protein AB0F16_17670 [Streptomyces tanashiensis]|uniref:hypothetical protein n=1 Tax=Streptomyces tanashiensis TaxID=67367 RepID=UPI0033C094EE